MQKTTNVVERLDRHVLYEFYKLYHAV